jgi:hypothetical protein
LECGWRNGKNGNKLNIDPRLLCAVVYPFLPEEKEWAGLPDFFLTQYTQTGKNIPNYQDIT